MEGFPRIPYQSERVPPEVAVERGEAFRAHLDRRRSVRHFADTPVPRRLVELAIQTASTAPSGAHQQPWTFVAVSDAQLKRQIRKAAEAEEKRSYETRMPDAWKDALAPLGTDWHKPYLETVPWIVVLFAQRWGVEPDGSKRKHYYVNESCGIAAGMFIAALHRMGLSTLTHTPAPMTFLSTLLQRPKNESPLILFPIGYPTDDCTVPDIRRKSLDEVSVWK